MTTVALRAARLLPDSRAELIQDGGVVVKAGRIVAAGSWSQIVTSLAGDEQVEDLGDVTLMPGLFDCHVHLQMDPSTPNTSTSITLSDQQLWPLISRNAQKLLDAGITTARDLGSRGLTVMQFRDRIAAGDEMGPRLHVANAPITVPGGHANAMGGVAQGVDAVRAEVRKRKAEGADCIKVMATGGFMTSGSGPATASYSQEEFNAMSDEAAKCGLPITTHATGTEGIARVVEANFSCIEHCAWINSDMKTKVDESVATKIVERGIAVCPTMNSACVEHGYFCPWDSRKAIVANLATLRAVGVKMIVGTDAGIGLCPFERYVDGLTVLADAGYTTREIIAGATDVAASVLGLSNETGRIAPGFAADLAAFSGNPLDDVQAFGKPTFVMARGRQHTLHPIAPLADHTEAKNKIFQTLRQGAGMA